MGLLLQRLACRLADRVAESVDIKARDLCCQATQQLNTDTSCLVTESTDITARDSSTQSTKQLNTDTTCVVLLQLGMLVRMSASSVANNPQTDAVVCRRCSSCRWTKRARF